jgi:hypothetical protein
MTPIHHIDARLAKHTPWKTLDALRAHVAEGGRGPSFRAEGTPGTTAEGRALARDLKRLGIPVVLY